MHSLVALEAFAASDGRTPDRADQVAHFPQPWAEYSTSLTGVEDQGPSPTVIEQSRCLTTMQATCKKRLFEIVEPTQQPEFGQ